jgi:hypothetical protein
MATGREAALFPASECDRRTTPRLKPETVAGEIDLHPAQSGARGRYPFGFGDREERRASEPLFSNEGSSTDEECGLDG